MTQRKHTPSSTAKFRACGVRLFNEQRSEYRSDNAAYQAIAPKLGCAPDSLRGWCLSLNAMLVLATVSPVGRRPGSKTLSVS
jgi:hypothetical protein